MKGPGDYSISFRVSIGEHQEPDEESENPKCRSRTCHGGRKGRLNCAPDVAETKLADVGHYGPGGKYIQDAGQNTELWINPGKHKIRSAKTLRYVVRRVAAWLQVEAAIKFLGCFAMSGVQKRATAAGSDFLYPIP